jgi:GGDEF domain-containing protein
MSMAENTVWAIMTGGLLSLALLAAAEAVVIRSLGAVRNLLLVVLVSGTAVLLCGLPEALFPGLPAQFVMVLKAGLGPLSNALGLRFLGMWTGGDREDPVVYRLTVWGSLGMLCAALALMVLAALAAPGDYTLLMLLSAAVNGLGVPLLMVVAVRATLLGDPLARWLVLACVILAGMVTGLYLHALKIGGFGLGLWMFTAACAVVFILMMTVLILLRNQANRRLARLARLETGSDPATGLPTGAKLLSEVEHAFWRMGRLQGKCVVVCVYLSNLYELGDSMGRTIDNQILAATSARIRRAAGFRCVVGMYHPRCFIIVFSTERTRVFDESLLARIRSLVTQPLQVVGSNDKRQQFLPQAGISALTVIPDHAQPQDVIHDAEQQAMDQMRRQPPKDDQADTAW